MFVNSLNSVKLAHLHKVMVYGHKRVKVGSKVI